MLDSYEHTQGAACGSPRCWVENCRQEGRRVQSPSSVFQEPKPVRHETVMSPALVGERGDFARGPRTTWPHRPPVIPLSLSSRPGYSSAPGSKHSLWVSSWHDCINSLKESSRSSRAGAPSSGGAATLGELVPSKDLFLSALSRGSSPLSIFYLPHADRILASSAVAGMFLEEGEQLIGLLLSVSLPASGSRW